MPKDLHKWEMLGEDDNGTYYEWCKECGALRTTSATNIVTEDLPERQDEPCGEWYPRI